MARVFGAGLIMDAFVNAFLLPNLLRRLVGEGALSSAFVAVLGTFRKDGDRSAVSGFISAVFTFSTFILMGITLLGLLVILFFPSSMFFEGRDLAKMNLTLELSLILFPYVLFVCLLALVTGVLNSWGRFAAPAIAPAVLNVFWVGGVVLAVFFLPESEGGESAVARIKVVAAAIFAGGVFQLVMQAPSLQKLGLRIRPSFTLRGSGLDRVLAMAVPIVVGLAPTQVNVFFDRVIAENLVPGDGAVSALFFGNRLMQFPLALVGIAMGTAVFPLLSSLAARNEKLELRTTLEKACRLTFFFAVPAGVGLVVLGKPIVDLLFQHGEFNDIAVGRTASVVVAYSFGIPAFCGLQIVTRGLYAVGRPGVASRAALYAVGFNIGLNLILVFPFGEAGLALSTAITSTAQLFYSWSRLSRLSGGLRGKRVLRSLFLSLLSSGVMGGSCLLLSLVLLPTDSDAGVILRSLALLMTVAVGGLIYFMMAHLLAAPESEELREEWRGGGGRPS